MGEKLFVGNLSFGTSDQDLRELFSTVGTCVSATVLMDRATGKSRGFGFVEMSSADEAHRAISRPDDHELQGRRSASAKRASGRRRVPRGPQRRGAPSVRTFRLRALASKEGGSRRGLRGRKRSL